MSSEGKEIFRGAEEGGNQPDLEGLRRTIAEDRKDPNDLLWEEMHEMREPLKNLARQLRERINEGKFDLIIGDDASGRLPALVLGEFITKVYDKHGRPHPKRMFFAGAGSKQVSPLTDEQMVVKEDQLVDFLAEHEPGKSALVVTELIKSAKGLKPLINALERNNIDCEMASLLVDVKDVRTEKKSDGDVKKTSKSVPVHFGRIIRDGSLPSIYRAEISGVYKNPKDLFAKPIKNIYNSPEGIQILVNETRRDVEILAQELFEWFEKGDD